MFNFYSRYDKKLGGKQARVVVTGQHSEGLLKIAASRCSTEDQFVKSIGRQKAHERLNNGNFYTVIKLNECPPKKFIEIAESISQKILKKPNYFKNKMEKTKKLLNNGN